MDPINYSALAMLIESNWGEFVEFCGSEEDAEDTLAAVKKKAGMDA